MNADLRVSVGGWAARAGLVDEVDADGCIWDLTDIGGWFGGLATRSLATDRVRGDGSHDGPLYFAARHVTLTGNVLAPDPVTLQAAMERIAGVLVSGDRSGTLTVDEVSRGRVLSAFCRLDAQGRAKRISGLAATWELDLVCPDPIRYGPPQTLSTGLPVAGGGLAWPLFGSGVLDWGLPGTTGQLVLGNAGTADAPVQFTVTGPLPAGFEISAAGQRLTYPVAVPAGQTIVIDTGAGTVLVEGTSSRRSSLTHADWLLVPAGGSLTVQFTNLGGTIALPTAETRRNLASDPRATAPVPSATTAGWSTSRWFGSGGAGTHSWITGAGDGPRAGIATYLRKTWTAGPSGNADTGFANTVGADNGTESTGLPVSGGTSYSISSYLRPSSGKDGGNVHVWWHDAAGRFLSEDGGPTSALPAGVWTRVSGTFTAPANAAFMQIVSDVDGGTTWAAGDTLDGTGLLIEATGTIGDYFDGSTPGSGSPSQPGSVLYAWTGTTNASASVAQVVQPGPQQLSATVSDCWW